MYHLFVKTDTTHYSEDGWAYSGPVSYPDRVYKSMEGAVLSPAHSVIDFILVDLDKKEFYDV